MKFSVNRIFGSLSVTPMQGLMQTYFLGRKLVARKRHIESHAVIRYSSYNKMLSLR